MRTRHYALELRGGRLVSAGNTIVPYYEYQAQASRLEILVVRICGASAFLYSYDQSKIFYYASLTIYLDVMADSSPPAKWKSFIR